jgi:purine-binding chemotaxis protein CheW
LTFQLQDRRHVTTANPLVVFALDNQQYALHLPAVVRTVRMVAITPLPQAPAIVTGVINLQGRVIPVLNIRQRFRLPERGERLSDQLIIARTAQRIVALVVDEVRGVIDNAAHEAVEPATIVPGIEHLEGVVKMADGMIFIHDLDRFLSLDEERALEAAITGNEA